MNDAQGSRAGSMFGPYHLKRPLGRGGMGEVYEAEHTVKGWTVAVKLMTETASKDPVFRERMKREARIAGRLQEPHVVPIHDYGEIDGQLFLEMRLIEGTDLDTLLKRFGPLTPPRAVAIATQIASALDAAHAAGVMHRDVKPHNILVTRDDFAYLVDFGIANAATDEKLTKLGTAVGTWKYMAPERFTNNEVTYRADVYALACVLYECLTGSPPYNSDSVGVLVSAHTTDPIPQPSAVRSGIPKAFDAVITQGMAKKPDDRYPSAGDLALAAHEALSDPDQDHAATILRRSQESALPGPKAEPRTIQQPRPPHRPSGGRGPSSGPPPGPAGPGPVGSAGPPPWAPASGPMPAASQPAAQNFRGNAWDPPPSVQPPAGTSQWNQAASSKERNPWRTVTVVAAVVVVLTLVAIGIWLAIPDNNNTNAAGKGTTTIRTTTRTTTATTTLATTTPPSSSASPDALNRLMSALPSGYPSGTCIPESEPLQGSLISVRCGQNTDTNGPPLSVYALYSDLGALNNAFTKFIGTFAPQECPGGGKSPGNWWHTKDPNTILGRVACGTYKGDEPQVMWSTQQTLVFGVADGKQQTPNLDQLYKWWTSHS